MAILRPVYEARNVEAVYSLAYNWTGFLADGEAWPSTVQEAVEECRSGWQNDDLGLVNAQCDDGKAMALFEAKPSVAPARFCAQVKGRLVAALRRQGTPVGFSRKLAFRSLGKNQSRTVVDYIQKQVGKEGFVDPRFESHMKQFTFKSESVDLSTPSDTSSGRYWYNLHLVLVVSGRSPIGSDDSLSRIHDLCLAVAEKRGHAIAALSVMPDHLHLALRGNVSMSPEEIALSFMNNTAYHFRQNAIWKNQYYVGTFSEYDLRAVVT